jgi:hypothetical protein
MGTIMNPADHRGRAVEGMKSLLSLERCNRAFESHSRHECLCVHLFYLCCPVCYIAALGRTYHSSKESYRLVYIILGN